MQSQLIVFNFKVNYVRGIKIEIWDGTGGMEALHTYFPNTHLSHATPSTPLPPPPRPPSAFFLGQTTSWMYWGFIVVGLLGSQKLCYKGEIAITTFGYNLMLWRQSHVSLGLGANENGFLFSIRRRLGRGN